MKMRRNFEILTVIFLGATSLLGCSKLDDMQNKTDQMAATTQSMSNDSSILKDTSLAMYADIRKSNTFDARKKARDCVTSSAALSDKLGCAKVYFYAFEFQDWKDEGLDDQAKLAKMKDDAVEEFFQFLTISWGPDSLLDTLKPLPPHTLDLYAYAAAIHEIDPDQLAQAQKKGFKAISLLSIIEDDLRADYRNPGRDPTKLPWWRYYVEVFHKNAIELMQKRITFMPLLAYAFLNHVETKSSFSLVYDSLIGSAVTISPDQETTGRLDFIGLILRRALMTRQFLNEIGMDATPVDSLNGNLNIHETYKKMRINYDSQNKDTASLFKSSQMVKIQQWVNLLYGSRDNFLKVDPASYVIIDR